MAFGDSKDIIESICNRSDIFHRRIGFRYERRALENSFSAILNYYSNSESYPQVCDRLIQFSEHTQPFVHSSVLSLMSEFLEYKRDYGSVVEQIIYQSMTVGSLAERLLTHRCRVKNNSLYLID